MLSDLLLKSEYTVRAMRGYLLKANGMGEEELFIAVNGGMNAVFALRDELKRIRDNDPVWEQAVRACGDEIEIESAVGHLRRLRNKATHAGALHFGERYEWVDTGSDGQQQLAYPTIVLGLDADRVTHSAGSFFSEIERAALWWRDHILRVSDAYEGLVGSREGMFETLPYWLSDNEALSPPLPKTVA